MSAYEGAVRPDQPASMRSMCLGQARAAGTVQSGARGSAALHGRDFDKQTLGAMKVVLCRIGGLLNQREVRRVWCSRNPTARLPRSIGTSTPYSLLRTSVGQYIGTGDRISEIP